MKRWFILLFIVNTCAVFSQEKIKPDGYNVFYYENGKISSEGNMRNGEPDGYWKTYYMTGVLKSEGNRSNHLLDGEWIFYNNVGDTLYKIDYMMGKKNGYYYTYNTDRENHPENVGNVISKELYVNDIKQGTSSYYYPDGKRKEIINYLNDKKDGKSWEYDENGTIITEKEFIKGILTNRERVNRTDKNGLKQGTWKEYFADGKVKIEETYKDNLLDGLYKEYDENGKLMLSLNYENGNIAKNDSTIDTEINYVNKYDSSGNLTFSGGYKNGIPVGIHRYYDKNGNVENSKIYNNKGIVVSEGIITDAGKKEGDWKDYFDSGKLRDEGNYKNNQKEGKWKYYFQNGKIEETGAFKNNRYTGEWIWYYDDGNVWRDENYYNGREDGSSVEYDTIGNVITKGDYVDGEKEGEWYYDVGDHIETGKYVTGLRDGKWKYFYGNGDIMFEGNYIQGNPDGKHKYYYPGNILKEEQYYVSGIKQGHWKKYDSKGELIITISYKDNKEYRINGIKVDLSEESIVLIK